MRVWEVLKVKWNVLQVISRAGTDHPQTLPDREASWVD